MSVERTIECPTCGGEVVVELTVDPNYGADADGNRGVSRSTLEVTKKDCTCDITDDDLDRLTEGMEDDYGQEEWDD